MKAILFNRILVVLAFIGLFVAGALSLEKVLNITLPCGNNSGCDIVASDPSSSLFGVIPVAYIGLFGYVLMAALAIARTMKTPYDLRLVTVGYAASGIGAAFSVYLQFISLTKIHAICPYCLTSAITMLLTLVVYALLALEVKKGPLPEREMGKVDLWLIAGIPFLVVVGLTFLTGATKAKTGVDVGKIEMNEKSLVPENPNSFGHADAPITIIEFADMCCPACQKTSPKVKEFAADNPSTVRLVYRHFPLKMHALGSVSAAMGEYAAEKGRFWDFMLSVMGLMRQPESLQELLDIAKSLGMDPADIKKRLSDKNDPVFDRVTRDMNVAHKLAIDSTPTFIILAKGLRPDSAGPSDVMDKLNGPIYKRILLGNG